MYTCLSVHVAFTGDYEYVTLWVTLPLYVQHLEAERQSLYINYIKSISTHEDQR